MKKTSTVITDFDKNFIFISSILITILLLFLYKSQCSYYINEYLLNKLGLEFCESMETFGRLLYILIFIFIFINAILTNKVNDIDYRGIIVLSIFFGIWIYSWTSPFSEGKSLSNIYKRNNTKWYYSNFNPIEKSIRSNVGIMTPSSLYDDLSQTQNYIFFKSDSIFLERTIGLNQIEFKIQIKDKFILENNKIQFNLKSKNIYYKIKDFNEYYLLSNSTDIYNFSFLNQFPSITKEDKEKIKNEINNYYFFKETGKVSFYISDINNRGESGYMFDCYYYDREKRLFYSKFSQEGYFNQR
jgi:hypothetical protein